MTDEPRSALDAAALWTQRSFVRAVAAGLLRDVHACEDVVQESFRAALEAERAPARPALASWLARTARRFALRELRTRERRERRERDAAVSERVRATSEIAAELALSRRIADAVLELDEPLRAAVLLRYYEGLSIAAAARELGAPATTVASRLERAHAALRAKLGGDERDSRALFLAGLRSLVSKPRGAPVLALASNARRALVAASLLLLGGGAFLALRARLPEPASRSIELGLARDEREPRALERGDEREALEAAPRAETALEPSAPLARAEVDAERRALAPGALGGRVTRGRDPVRAGLVLAKLDRSFAELERPWRDAEGVLATSLDEDGRFRFDALAPGAYVVGYEPAPGEPLFELWGEVSAEQEGRELALVLGRARVRGTIRDADALPIAGAIVHLGPQAALGDPFHRFAPARFDGGYELGDLQAGPYWWGCEPGGDYRYWFAPDARSVPIHLEPAETLVQDLGRARPLPRVTGGLVCADGVPARGPGSLLVVDEAGGYFETRFDEHGRFELRLEPGRYRARPRLPSGELPWIEGIEIQDADADLRWVLSGTRVVGRIAFADGEVGALAGTEVALGEHAERRRAEVDGAGRFVFEAVAPGDWPLAARYPLAPSSATRVALRAGELEVAVELVVAPIGR